MKRNDTEMMSLRGMLEKCAFLCRDRSRSLRVTIVYNRAIAVHEGSKCIAVDAYCDVVANMVM